MTFCPKKIVLGLIVAVSWCFVHSANAELVMSLDVAADGADLGFLELSCKDHLQPQTKPDINFLGMRANIGKNGFVRFSQTYNIVSARSMSRTETFVPAFSSDKPTVPFEPKWSELEPSEIYVGEYTPLVLIQWHNRSEFFFNSPVFATERLGSRLVSKTQQILLGDVTQLIFADRSFSGEFDSSSFTDNERTASLPFRVTQPSASQVQ